MPNAGLPDENGRYLETPAMIARTLRRFAEEGWLNVVGGCCGTTPEHVRAIAEAVRGLPLAVPTRAGPPGSPAWTTSRWATTCARSSSASAPTSSAAASSRSSIVAEQWEDASEVARAQVKRGAQVIDVCLANPDRDELRDMERFLGAVIRKVRVPLMIDSTDEKVVERSLTYCQGKAIINSINLEDGEERFHKVVPLARRYGAALIVGCIDETGHGGAPAGGSSRSPSAATRS